MASSSSLPEAEADAGWPQLVEFLTMAGLKPAVFERTLTQFAAEDITNLTALRRSFPTLKLTAYQRAYIGDALNSTLRVGGPQQLPAPLPLVAFNVSVSFKKQEVTVRLALTGEDYGNRPVKALLPHLDLLAAQHLSGAYKIIGLLLDDGQLANGQSLRAQAVPVGCRLVAAVEEMSLVHALAAGKAKAAPRMVAPTQPAPPKPMPERASDGKFKLGSAATYTGQKPGPNPDKPKVDKSTKPPLWVVGSAIVVSGKDVSARMDAMAAKVEAAGGKPAAGEGAGRGIWCEPCRKLQPLAKAFELFPWNKHVDTDKHKAAARMYAALQPAHPQEPPPQVETSQEPSPQEPSPQPCEAEFGSEGWLAVRTVQWRTRGREMRAVRVVRQRASESELCPL